jgi:hypothetical protein
LQLSINLVCVSAVASQSVNNVFTSTYDNYILQGNIFNTGGEFSIAIRLRASGVDATAGNYDAANFRTNFLNPTTFANFVSGLNLTSFTYGASDTNAGFFEINIANPNKAQRTAFHALNTAGGGHFASCRHSLTTQYDGFTIFPSANNITGYVSVFGVNK